MKRVLQGLAAVLALSGMAATPQTTVQVQQHATQQSRQHHDAIDKQFAVTPVTRMEELKSSGALLHNSGLSPKEYGEMLQRTGRQKWVKAGRPKRR